MKTNIELNNWNLEKASIAIVKKLIDEHPFKTQREYADLLGMSERTFYRWLNKYKIKISDNRKLNNTAKAIRLLERQGFNVRRKVVK